MIDRIEVGFTQFANIFGTISGNRTLDRLLEPFFKDIDWEQYPTKRDQIIYLLKTYRSNSTDLRIIVQTIIDAHPQQKWIEKIDIINDYLNPMGLKISHTYPDKNKVEIDLDNKMGDLMNNINNTQTRPKKWDVFISHASEDKDAVARPLAEELKKRGLRVWYDEFKLTIGDSLRERIDIGLRDSTYGVVILSKAFFAKDWPRKELDGLNAREWNGKKVILPIWHDLTRDEVEFYSPMLAGRLAAKTEEGINKVAEKIMRVFDEDNLVRDTLVTIPDSNQVIYPADKLCRKKIEEISKWLPPTLNVIHESLITGDSLRLGLNSVLLRKYLEVQIPELKQATRKCITKRAFAKEFVSALESLQKSADLHVKAVDCYNRGEIDDATQFMMEGRKFSQMATIHIDKANKIV